MSVGLSTLGKWVSQYRPTDLVSAPQADFARENERLRLENHMLKKEKAILKRLPSSSRTSDGELRIRAQLAACLASADIVSRDAGIDARLPVLARTADKPAITQ